MNLTKSAGGIVAVEESEICDEESICGVSVIVGGSATRSRPYKAAADSQLENPSIHANYVARERIMYLGVAFDLVGARNLACHLFGILKLQGLSTSSQGNA